MVLFSEKSSKYIGIVILSAILPLYNAFGERHVVSLTAFFDKARWQENKEKAQSQYGDEWKEEYFKNPKAVYKANLRDDYKEKLSNTHLYVLVSSYRQASLFGEEVVKSLEANAQHLAELGVTPHIIVRCDGEKTEAGKNVISGDLRTYAKILDTKKIAFKVHESKGVKPSDFNYEYHNPEAAHWGLVANEKNLGCSGTRHASIDMIDDEVSSLQRAWQSVYIGIFDGDDWVHEDYYSVLLLNALYANACVSNYNGRMGAHGLEGIGLRTKRMLGIGKEYAWTVYTDMQKDDIQETLSKKYQEQNINGGGQCCTTKIFEAGYFYGKLNLLYEEKLKGNSGARREWIDLTELSCLNGFGTGACTCTTPIEETGGWGKGGSLFHYTQHR